MPDDTSKPSGPLTRGLQGRWLGHPLHPMLVHLPIGLWGLSVILDVLSLTADNPADARPLADAAFYTLIAGLLFATLAIVTGFADYTDVRKDHPGRRTATQHMVLNLAAFVVFGVSAWLRMRGTTAPAVPVGLSVLALLHVLISGYLGGVMVYDDGIGVGRHRRKHDSQSETLKITAAADAGFVDVLDIEDLTPGVPLRAEVNGTVLVLLRHGGEIHAFQEFCTHRFGPLSEGKVVDDQIMCPWHRSCFEVRSGKVTNGPAKVDLKTYPTREDRGRIWVRIPS